jgi:hypothetical protein
MSGAGHTRRLTILFGLSISKCEMDHISFPIFCPEIAPRRDEGVKAIDVVFVLSIVAFDHMQQRFFPLSQREDHSPHQLSILF